MCRDCKFYKLIVLKVGQCQAHPPVVLDSGETRWPEVEQGDWCGEYQDRTVPATPGGGK